MKSCSIISCMIFVRIIACCSLSCVRHFINLNKLFAGKFFGRGEIKYPNFQAIFLGEAKFWLGEIWRGNWLGLVGGQWGIVGKKVLLANDFFILVYH